MTVLRPMQIRDQQLAEVSSPTRLDALETLLAMSVWRRPALLEPLCPELLTLYRRTTRLP